MARIVSKKQKEYTKKLLVEQEEFGMNSENIAWVWQEQFQRSRSSMAKIVSKEQEEYGKNSAKGAGGVWKE